MIALQLCSLCNVVFATLHTILSYCTLFTNATRKFPQVPTSQHMDLKAGIHRLNDTVIYVCDCEVCLCKNFGKPKTVKWTTYYAHRPSRITPQHPLPRPFAEPSVVPHLYLPSGRARESCLCSACQGNPPAYAIKLSSTRDIRSRT